MLFIVLPFAVSGFIASAQTNPELAIRAPNVTDVEFRAVVRTRSLKPLSESVRKLLLKESSKQLLFNRFVEAQRTFLSADLSLAERSWSAVTDLAYEEDWDASSRHAIMTAFLRLSQTSAAPSEALKEAAAFDPNYRPDEKLFPPPLVRQFNDTVQQQEYIEIPAGRWRRFSLAIINGVEFPATKRIRVPAAMARVTLISDTYRPVMQVLHTSDLARFEPPQIPMLKGSCSKPDHSAIPAELRRHVFAVYGGCRANTIENAVASSPTPSAPVARYAEKFDSSTGRSKSILKNPYFWVGAGLVLGVIVYQNQDRGSDQRPATVKDGF